MSNERDDQPMPPEHELAHLPRHVVPEALRARVRASLEGAGRAAGPEVQLRALPSVQAPRGLAARTVFLVQTAGRRSARVMMASPRLAFGLTAAVVIVLALGVWPLLRARVENVAEPAIARAPDAVLANAELRTTIEPTVHVRAVSGRVEVRRDGRQAPLRVGDAVQSGDAIVASSEGRAVVGVADLAEVTVDASTELVVDTMSRGLVRVELRRGRAQGSRQPSGGPFRLAFASGGDEVTIVRGEVGLVRTGIDRLTLAALTPDAVVERGGRRLALPEHHLVSIDSRTRDLVARPAPTKLMLALHQAQVLRPGDRELTIQGTAPVGVILIINAREVPVAPSGEFVLRLPAQGVDRVDAHVRDALGRTLARSLTVTRVSHDAPWKEPG